MFTDSKTSYPLLFSPLYPHTMKIVLTLAFLIITLTSNAQISQSSDRDQLHALIEESFDVIFSQYQLNRLDEFYTKDFLLLEQGEIWDLEILNAKLSPNQNSLTTRTNRFEFIKTEIDGNRAWIAYHNWAEFSRADQESRKIYWLESATAIKTPNGWRLDLLHSTRGKKMD